MIVFRDGTPSAPPTVVSEAVPDFAPPSGTRVDEEYSLINGIAATGGASTSHFVLAYYDVFQLVRGVRRRIYSCQFTIFSQELDVNGAFVAKEFRFPTNGDFTGGCGGESRINTATISRDANLRHVFVFDDRPQWLSAQQF